MSDRSDELALRRKGLELRSERLRRELAEDAEIVGETVTRVDHAVDSARRYASPALLLVGGVVLIVALASPARTLAWLARGAVALSIARRALGLYRHLRAELSQLRQ